MKELIFLLSDPENLPEIIDGIMRNSEGSAYLTLTHWGWDKMTAVS